MATTTTNEKGLTHDSTSEEVARVVDSVHAKYQQMCNELSGTIVGMKDVTEQLMIGILCKGHCILQGMPGLAKTLLISQLARLMDLSFHRIQFTPDLMPADITGGDVLEEDRTTGKRVFRFLKGPLFANLILADEINRTPPKTQSALLEAMEERQLSVGGTTYPLPEPFFVLATQNPIEVEGTYPLPEAQLDRFLMKILVRYPSREDLSTIVTRTIRQDEVSVAPVLARADILQLRRVCREVLVAPHVQSYAIDLVMATQPEGGGEGHEMAKKFIRYGSSPRGAQALVECGQVLALMRGRLHLAIEDVQTIAAAVLRHRIILNFDAHADGQTPETVLDKIIPSVGTHASAKV